MEKVMVNFTIDHFRQMLYIVPDLFLHRWDITLDKTELLVDFPANVKEIFEREAFEQNEPVFRYVSFEIF